MDSFVRRSVRSRKEPERLAPTAPDTAVLAAVGSEPATDPYKIADYDTTTLTSVVEDDVIMADPGASDYSTEGKTSALTAADTLVKSKAVKAQPTAKPRSTKANVPANPKGVGKGSATSRQQSIPRTMTQTLLKAAVTKPAASTSTPMSAGKVMAFKRKGRSKNNERITGLEASDDESEDETAPKKRAKASANTEKDTALETRPLPSGKPDVWAERRQELCETLPNFRAYQSGAYFTAGLVQGFLLAKDSSDRRYMDDEIAIVRAGGHCTSDGSGNMAQTSPHSMTSAGVQSFFNSMRQKCPLIVVCGQANVDCPTRPLHPYSVLGYFQVTDIWWEKNNGVSCIKFRLEKIDLTGKSWWAPLDRADRPAIRDFEKKAHVQDCATCSKSSKQIFARGWTCLEETCAQFWMFPTGIAPTTTEAYNPDYLEERTEWKWGPPPFASHRKLFKLGEDDDPNVAFGREAWKGIVCPKCGRCNSRYRWEGWVCDADDCDFTHDANQPILSPSAVLNPHEALYDGTALPLNAPPTYPVEFNGPRFINDWRISDYKLCEGNSISHYAATSSISTAPGGPDEMFRAIQEGKGCKMIRGEMNSFGDGLKRASHFAANWGMEYKYVVKMESQPFKNAPPVMINAMSYMTWAARDILGDGKKFDPFNEMLTVGYYQDCKMGYHDDGEVSLGPIIATLSLGGTAEMTMRMKLRYYYGLTKTGKYNPDEPVLPGSYMEKERIELNKLKDQLSTVAFEKKRKAMYAAYEAEQKTIRTDQRASRNPPVLVKIVLKHGDIVLMHGSEMQKYYEHMIVPQGRLRFALTARYVKPEFVHPSEHWKADYDKNLYSAYNGHDFVSGAERPAISKSPELPLAHESLLAQQSSSEVGASGEGEQGIASSHSSPLTSLDPFTPEAGLAIEVVRSEDYSSSLVTATGEKTPDGLSSANAGIEEFAQSFGSGSGEATKEGATSLHTLSRANDRTAGTASPPSAVAISERPLSDHPYTWL